MEKWIKGKIPNWTKALLDYTTLTYRIKNRRNDRTVEDEIILRLCDHLYRYEFIDDVGEFVERDEKDRMVLMNRYKKTIKS